MIKTYDTEQSILIIIENNNSQILVYKEPKKSSPYYNQYRLPGGKVQRSNNEKKKNNEISIGESIVEAAKRKMIEEFGIEINIYEKPYFYFFDKRRFLKKTYYVYVTKAIIISGTPIRREIDKVGNPEWISIHELLLGNFTEDCKISLLRYILEFKNDDKIINILIELYETENNILKIVKKRDYDFYRQIISILIKYKVIIELGKK